MSLRNFAQTTESVRKRERERERGEIKTALFTDGQRTQKPFTVEQ